MNWVTDIKQMHAKFGVHDWLDHSTPEDRSKLMKLRIRMLTEEYGETQTPNTPLSLIHI